MKFKIGDTVEINIGAEGSQHELLHMIDGMLAKVTEVYQVSFDPEIDRYEVELLAPVEYEGQEVSVIPGLYEDNLEAANRLTESRVLSAKEFLKDNLNMKHLKVFENFNEQSAERNMSMVFSRNGGSSIYPVDLVNYSVDLVNFPTQIKKDVTGVSREELDELSSLGIEDFIEVEDHYLTEVHLEYQMTPVKDSAGISDINFQLKWVKIVGEYEVWNEETDETDSVDFQIIDDGPFDERVTFTTSGLPIYPENVEIDMNGSMDHTNFKYSIEA